MDEHGHAAFSPSFHAERRNLRAMGMWLFLGSEIMFFTAFFGFVGYALIKFGLEPAPMLLGFVLGRLLEEKLRQALVLSRGSLMTFVERPVSAVLLVLAAAILIVALLPAVRRGREDAFTE